MDSLGREPAGGSEMWPRPGIAGHRPLAGDGASRRPKAVSSPRYVEKNKKRSRGAATDTRLRRLRLTQQLRSVAPPGLIFLGPLYPGLTPRANHLSPLRGLGPGSADRPIESSPHDCVWNPRGGTCAALFHARCVIPTERTT